MPGTPLGLRYFATGEGRNYFVTQLVAEIADNYYGLMRWISGLRTWITSSRCRSKT